MTDEIIKSLAKLKKGVDYLLTLGVPGSGAAGGGTYNPDAKPGAPSAYDDEFESGALDVKWTAINCGAGTVDMLTTAAAADTYDPTTYMGMMALQPGRDDAGAGGPEAQAAILRQTVVLGATCKVVVKLRNALTFDTAGTVGLSGAGIVLSGATGLTDNDVIAVGIGPAPAWQWGAWGIVRIGGGGPINTSQYGVPANPEYAMITKTGNDFSAWVGDGHSWAALTDANAPDNTVFTFGAGVMVRLSILSYWAPPVAEVNLFNPISVFDYVRYFTNNTPVTNA